MRITNLTGERILCFIDEERNFLDNRQYIDANSFERIRIFHISKSYSIKECGNSRVLKLLGCFDDPFQLRREYHLVVDVEILKSQLCNSEQLTITAKTNYVDVETRTYYEYFVVKCDGKQIMPHCVVISDCDKISADFTSNNRKIIRWDAIWNILIEPLWLEVVGYFMMYKLLSLWIGTTAKIAVLFLIVLNLLVEIVFFIFKMNTRRENGFYYYLEETAVQKNCYKEQED